MRTVPRVAERAVARPRATASAASCIRRAASAMASAAPVGVDAAAGALEERRAELRLELGDVAAQGRLRARRCACAAAVTLPASRTARKLRTRRPVEVGQGGVGAMRKCMAPIHEHGMAMRPCGAHTARIGSTSPALRWRSPCFDASPAPSSSSAPTAASASPLRRPSPPPAGTSSPTFGATRRPACRRAPSSCARRSTSLADALAGRPAPSVVVHAVNPIYTRWDEEALPAARAGWNLAERFGARFMLPGNVYNYGAAMPARLDETTPQRPTTAKGRIRVEMEQRARTARRRRPPALDRDHRRRLLRRRQRQLVRRRSIVKPIAKGRLDYPGRPGAGARLGVPARPGARLRRRRLAGRPRAVRALRLRRPLGDRRRIPRRRRARRGDARPRAGARLAARHDAVAADPRRRPRRAALARAGEDVLPLARAARARRRAARRRAARRSTRRRSRRRWRPASPPSASAGAARAAIAGRGRRG